MELTSFYGNPKTTRKGEEWSLLRHLRDLAPMSWLCIGDFNKIIRLSEKHGVVLHLNR
jgi:hypothetical protein